MTRGAIAFAVLVALLVGSTAAGAQGLNDADAGVKIILRVNADGDPVINAVGMYEQNSYLPATRFAIGTHDPGEPLDPSNPGILINLNTTDGGVTWKRKLVGVSLPTDCLALFVYGDFFGQTVSIRANACAVCTVEAARTVCRLGPQP